MSSRRKVVIVAGIMLSLFMASMEATVIATAMPTIVTQLGGLAIYSWVFSAYMLMSTCTVPVYGKLSDLYGRRAIYGIGMTMFLAGSILCGFAQSMEQLILFRAIQGMGAGGVLPLVFIIVGDIFSFEQRAKMQGLFSGVWGVSSIVGPLLGGFLVDAISWRWVFFVNVAPGALAMVIVLLALQDERDTSRKVTVDYAGAGLLMGSVVVLLLGLAAIDRPLGMVLLAVAAGLFVALWAVERRSSEPILPLGLFRDRLFATATLHGVLAGWAMFGCLSFVPLFVQAVLGTSATDAGTTLTPMMLAWVVGSIVGGRLLLRMGYRTVSLAGMVSLTGGALLLSQSGVESSRLSIMVFLAMMGTGMGLSIPSFLIAVQSAVERRQMGTATSTLQFSRSIGGTLGVSVMGVFLTMRLASALTARGIDPESVALESLIEPVDAAAAVGGAAMDGPLREALAYSIQGVFLLAFIAAAIGLVATAFAPSGRIGQPAAAPAPANAPEVPGTAAGSEEPAPTVAAREV